VKKLSISLGFTLIELLVVIAILGVLAGGVLVAINPLEQLARGRDAGRKTTVDQLGKAIQSYYTSQSATYPAADAVWMSTIQSSGELKTLPTNPAGGSNYDVGCNTGFNQRGYCYNTDDVEAIVYAKAESKSSFTSGTCTAGEQVWIVWSSEQGKTGLTCTSNASTDPALTGLIIK
jgi:prepilin-type N-terminal cleavage/methylation domain-containing protein